MNRRVFVTGLGAVLAAPGAVGADQKVSKIGVIEANAAQGAASFYASFWERLRDLGWTEGQNLVVELRGGAGDINRVQTLAAELVQLNVNVIVMDNGTFARRVRAQVTSTVPICVVGGDLQLAGAVANLAKPEGNITGVQIFQADLAGKRLALLKEIVPGLTRVGVLLQGREAPINISVLRASENAARTLGLRLYVLDATHPDNFDRSFSTLTNAGARGLLVLNNPSTVVHRDKVIALAAKSRLVAIYETRNWALAGGLMVYGPLLSESWRQLAECVDKILKGAKPADLPVEQPTKFELIINLKTAKTLGLTIPPSLLLRADQVIE